MEPVNSGGYAPWEPGRIDKPTDEVDDEPTHLYAMPCETNVGPKKKGGSPDNMTVMVDGCDHHFNFLRQETVSFGPEEGDTMPDERYDVWVCRKCLRYERVQV